MSKSLGQEGYEEYMRTGPNPGRTYNDLPMPTWGDLDKTEAGRITRARWEASALHIAKVVTAANVEAGSDRPPPSSTQP